MKKIFTKLKESKALKTLFNVAVDSVPFGGTVKNIVGSLWVDKDGDGKVSLKELNWPAIGGLVGIAILLRFDIVEKADLLFVADLILKILGG